MEDIGDKTMLGAIIGDIVGSRFEFNNYRKKDFEFFSKECFFTDDSIMSLAIAKALMESKKDYSDLKEKAIYYMQTIGRNYPDCGYGLNFFDWIFYNPKPYNSFGNGAAMRISAVGFLSKDLEEAVKLSDIVTGVSHNHPEGIKGARAIACCIYLARIGKSKEEIKEYVIKNYYNINFKLNEIRDSYEFNEICQNSVPQALEAFFESTSFEDAIRNAISIGGDSDTIGAICGGVAQAYYGIEKSMQEQAKKFLDKPLLKILEDFEKYIEGR